MAIGITLAVGKRQPQPDQIAALHFDECDLPCWIGIVPGETRIADARLQIQRVYGDSSLYQINTREEFNFNIDVLIKASGDLININMQPTAKDDIEHAKVRDITILLRPASDFKTSVVFGQLFDYVEMPTLIGQSPSMNANRKLFFFRNNRVLAYLDETFSVCTKYSVTDPVNFIYLFGDDLSEETLTLLFQRKWVGFKSCYDFTSN